MTTKGTVLNIFIGNLNFDMGLAVFNVEINRERLFEDYLTLINGNLSLTDKEIEILARFLKVMFDKGETDNIFSTEIRKAVSEHFQIKNVNTYVKKFIDKGLVNKKGDNFYPINLLIPQDKGITFRFKWV